MKESCRWIYEKTDLKLVENWFRALVAANERLLEEANFLFYSACDGKEITPNEKIRRLELLSACVRHNVRLAERGEKMRLEVFKDPADMLEKYQAHVKACDVVLSSMPKAGF
ncbi:MAG: hypothetical protein HYS18_13055 [Burkholderiales bacterium]|nr:hypothetical protein [Burkholderiales bacterium]